MQQIIADVNTNTQRHSEASTSRVVHRPTRTVDGTGGEVNGRSGVSQGTQQGEASCVLQKKKKRKKAQERKKKNRIALGFLKNKD